MVTLKIRESKYFAPADEDWFFRWLQAITGVQTVQGNGEFLEVTIDPNEMDTEQLHNLIGLFARYGLSMKELRQLETPSNSKWFGTPTKLRTSI